MSKLATYTFLPWLRQGIANQISGTTGSRATIPIDLTLEGKGVGDNPTKSGLISKSIQIYGPGDVIGIDPKSIVKVEPRNWITNFEPNYLPYIEFYSEGFPWQYSPMPNPAANHRLTPWLALIILKEDEFEDGQNIKDKPLPFIKLKDSAVLQASDQLWAWAHVHVNESLIDGETNMKTTDEAAIAAKLDALIDRNPDLAYSRIVCPRKLEEKAAYHAFLIPTFETGRLAGLGQNPESTAFDMPAWDSAKVASGVHEMPFYHRWYFRTGTVGDFEYLVRLLEPRVVDSRVGVRDMDVQDPGANLKGLREEGGVAENDKLHGILKLGGALKIPDDSYTTEEFEEVEKYRNWATLNNPYPHPFQSNIAAFINLSDNYKEDAAGANETAQNVHDDSSIEEVEPSTVPVDPTEEGTVYDIKNNPDPLITAPLYGQWHALTQRLLKERDNTTDLPNKENWVHDLNLDPRWRVAAGFGTKVVQENQENYMEAAWKQVGEVLEANKKIKQAQLARAAMRTWYVRHLTPLKEKRMGKWLNLTAPVHTRILSQGTTVINEEINKDISTVLDEDVGSDVNVVYQQKQKNGVPITVKQTLKNETTTVFYQKKESIVTDVITSAKFRSLTRKRGKLASRLKFDENVNLDNLITRINDGEVTTAPPKVAPTGIQTADDLAEMAELNGLPDVVRDGLEKYPWLKWIPLILVLIILLIILLFPLATIMLGILVAAAAGLIYLYRQINLWTSQINNAKNVLEENQTVDSIDALPKSPNFRLSTPDENFVPSQGSTDSNDAIVFKAALKENIGIIDTSARLGQVLERPKLDLPKVNEAIFQGLEPNKTIKDWTFAGVLIPPFIQFQMREQFTEAMAYPKFDLPMYKPLADHSAELFLPNINFITQNSISILETNQEFIEAYMVGLNHEFARELLWREYPTDQRGSYFRQFWETSGYMDTEPTDRTAITARYAAILAPPAPAQARIVPDLQEYYDKLKSSAPVDNDFLEEAKAKILKEELKDIKPIHTWPNGSDLGDHDNREENGDKENEVVLVIRGELLKKYPTAVIYAHRAQWRTKEENGVEVIDNTQERLPVELTEAQSENPPTDIIKSPLYEAKVDPDIYFFGFDLTVEEAKGGTGENPDDDPGWFFAIKERPGEPRFGLDVGGTENMESNELELWNDFGWDSLTPSVADNEYIQITDSAATTPTITATQALETDDAEKIPQQDEDVNIIWSKDMNAAELAYILYQVPVLVAVHASEMLPK